MVSGRVADQLTMILMTTNMKEDLTETETVQSQEEMATIGERTRMKIGGLTTDVVHTTTRESLLKIEEGQLKMNVGLMMTENSLTIVGNPMKVKDTTKIVAKQKREK